MSVHGLKEGVRRRVRKSRQKEAAGAADAGPMQIEWANEGCRSSWELSEPMHQEPTALCAQESSQTWQGTGRRHWRVQIGDEGGRQEANQPAHDQDVTMV